MHLKEYIRKFQWRNNDKSLLSASWLLEVMGKWWSLQDGLSKQPTKYSRYIKLYTTLLIKVFRQIGGCQSFLQLRVFVLLSSRALKWHKQGDSNLIICYDLSIFFPISFKTEFYYLTIFFFQNTIFV